MAVIYEISDATHTYVGKTVHADPVVRFEEHLRLALKGIQTPFYRWLGTGPDAKFRVLCKCGLLEADDYEREHIQEAREGAKKCLNLQDGGQGGWEHWNKKSVVECASEPSNFEKAERRLRVLQEKWKRRKEEEYAIEASVAAELERWEKEEKERANRNHGNRGKIKSEEHRRKLSAHLERIRPDNTGSKRSEVTKAKMSKSSKKRKRGPNGQFI